MKEVLKINKKTLEATLQNFGKKKILKKIYRKINIKLLYTTLEAYIKNN